MASPKVKKSGKGSKAQSKKATEPAQGPIGNTGGVYAPQPSPNISGGPTKIPIVPQGAEEKSFLEKKQEALQKGIDDWVEKQGDSKLAMASGALATALNQVFFPTAWYELIPAGKGLKLVKKGKEGIEAANKARKAEETLKDVKKTEKVADKTKEVKKADAKSGGNKKGKKKLDCGELGKYGDQKKRTGDNKYDRDHVPSKAALKERAAAIAKERGEKLTEAQAKAIENLADAIVIPKSTHKNSSPSYGSKNKKLSKTDGQSAEKLNEALERDLDAVLADLEKTDPECAKQYRAAAKKLREKVKKDSNYFDDFLSDVLEN
jgi:protein-tyrosine-phosphatase